MREIAVLAEAELARACAIAVFAEALGGPAEAERASVCEIAVFAEAQVATVREIAMFAEAPVGRAPETPSCAKFPLERKCVYRYILIYSVLGLAICRVWSCAGLHAGVAIPFTAPAQKKPQ